MCGTPLFDEQRKARKPHRCEMCRKVIEVGETYHHAGGRDGGDFYTVKTCLDCEEEVSAFFVETGEDCVDLRGYFSSFGEGDEPYTEHGRRIMARRELRWAAESDACVEARERDERGVGRIPEVVR